MNDTGRRHIHGRFIGLISFLRWRIIRARELETNRALVGTVALAFFANSFSPFVCDSGGGAQSVASPITRAANDCGILLESLEHKSTRQG